MKPRQFMDFFIGIIITVAAAYMATVIGAHSMSASALLRAQKRLPLLWFIDVGAVILGIFASALLGQMRSVRSKLLQVHQESRQQLESLQIMQSIELERLQKRMNEDRKSFEEEAKKLADQAYEATRSELEAHSSHLDAINLALQYHRAELQKLRHSVRNMEDGIPSQGLLFSAEPAEDEEIQSIEAARHPESQQTLNGPATVIAPVAEFMITEHSATDSNAISHEEFMLLTAPIHIDAVVPAQESMPSTQQSHSESGY